MVFKVPLVLTLSRVSVYFKTGISGYVSVYKHACVQGGGEGSTGVSLFSVPPHPILFVCGVFFVCLFSLWSVEVF